MNLRLLIVLASLTSLVVLAPLSRAPAHPPSAADATISVVDNAFHPAGINIAAGATVSWVLNGSAAHTTTSEAGLWDSGVLAAAQPFIVTFDAPGTFRFFCKNHIGMTGTITVTPPAYLPIVFSGGPAGSTEATETAQALTATAGVEITPSPTPTEEHNQSYGLHGAARVRPRWASTAITSPPIAYQVILDVSGSMSWNFAGQAGDSGNPIQCAGVPPSGACAAPWNPDAERRIYIAKQALNQFIDSMGTSDTMRIISFRGNLNSNFGEQNAIDYLTKPWPLSGWSSDKILLKSSLLSAGAIGNDPYLTSGAAPSASAFAAGRQVLAGAPANAPDGRPYRQVVIFLTDSVANVFLDGQLNTAEDICPGDPLALDSAQCQVGTAAGDRLRPISALVDQANRMKQDNPARPLYVVALAGMDTTGLDQVVSAPHLLFTAEQPADVGTMLGLIQSDLQSSTCTPAGGDQWVDRVDAPHTPAFPPPNNLPPGVFGYVYLYDQHGAPLPAGRHQLPITHDGAGGALAFTLPADQGLAPGTYQLRAYAGYKGEDAVSRQYDWIIDQNTQVGSISQSFEITGTSAGPVIEIDPLDLDLQPAVQLCP